jgi:hypothetical protein
LIVIGSKLVAVGHAIELLGADTFVLGWMELYGFGSMEENFDEVERLMLVEWDRMMRSIFVGEVKGLMNLFGDTGKVR